MSKDSDITKPDLKSGKIFYSSSGRILKWKKYKKNAPPEYVFLVGRWQEMNEYCGWNNCGYNPEQDTFDRWA